MDTMGRINVRYYKAHPPEKEWEWSPATYIQWRGMTPEQRASLTQWGKDVNKILLNAWDQLSTALIDTFKHMQPAIEMVVEASNRYNADYILQHPDEVKTYSEELFKDCEPDMRGEI